mgnify:CR=1 FL=1
MADKIELSNKRELTWYICNCGGKTYETDRRGGSFRAKCEKCGEELWVSGPIEIGRLEPEQEVNVVIRRSDVQ